MPSARRKMVVVRTGAGDQWFETGGTPDASAPYAGGYPFGGTDVPVARYVIEGGKIKGEILATAPLPVGHEEQAKAHYRCLLAYYLRTNSAKGIGTLPDLNPLRNVDPDRNPEAWLSGLHQVFSGLSPYEDADDDEFRPMPAAGGN